MENCLFCKIIKGDIPSQKVYEDEYAYAFNDIEPQAPVHVIIVPKIHIESANDINQENSLYVAKIFEAAAKIASELGLSEEGFRIVNNCGELGGQTVMHIHFHLMGKRQFMWPAG